MPPRAIDLTGKRFGNLVVIRRAEGEGTKWLCQCDCGNEMVARSNFLRDGQTISCKACKPTLLSFFEYRNMMFLAARRGIIWDLNRKLASLVADKPCHYCGNETWLRGIARVDRELGYILSNVVSCCERCGKARDAMGPEPFEGWIAQIRSL